MDRRSYNHDSRPPYPTKLLRYALVLAALSGILASGCSELERPRSEDFFAQATPPRKQELRWSNGKLPKTIDPAKAAAAPETDVVRAIFEGLTELDSKTLIEKPATAAVWNPSSDFRQWTFELRPDAKWSNGDQVTADDFVRSWKRASALGKNAPHSNLFSNIVGFGEKPAKLPISRPNSSGTGSNSSVSSGSGESVPEPDYQNSNTSNGGARVDGTTQDEPIFGVEAKGQLILVVTLIEPDHDLPKLVSHPVFRPVHGTDGISAEISKPSPTVVSNGPFRISEVSTDGVVLDRSENYWNRNNIRLERVHFVPAESAEKALEAYRAGSIDAITNTAFSPVLLKLLSPYEDFRRTTFAAINFYEFNTDSEPFNDRRVRQALSMSIERDRLSDGELEGATISAPTFMPFASTSATGYAQDRQRAADLLDEAGYPNGQNFPVVRLVVNRNDTQQRIARSVAAMWQNSLNIETEIIVKETSEIEAIRESGDFDLIRRGVVLSTPDEVVNIRTIFGNSDRQNPIDENQDRPSVLSGPVDNAESNTSLLPSREEPGIVKLTSHEQALYELRAIPLYFPSSYSLVKPFVIGFESNSLDAHSLLETFIDESWQPNSSKKES